MAVKKKPEEVKAGAPEYMNTYGDLVTLLLCFFVLLFAMSTVDAAKFEAMVNSFSINSPISVVVSGGKETVFDLYGSGIMQMPTIEQIVNADNIEELKKAQDAQQELSQMSSDFKTYFAENNVAEQIQVEVKDQTIVLTFKEGVLFDSGKDALKQSARGVLDIVVEQLSQYPDNDIEVQGNTDTDPINTIQFPSNWHLSSSRAIAVGQYFIEEKGFSPERLRMLGRGQYNPVAPNDTIENKAKNRRVEIIIKSREYSD